MLTQNDIFLSKVGEITNEAQAHITDIDNKVAVKQNEINTLLLERENWVKLSDEAVRLYPSVSERMVDAEKVV